MKSHKIVGFAVLAALLAMAAPIGAPPAVAETTALCKVDESSCSEANEVTHVHETTLTGNLATLLNSVGNVTCDVLFLGDTETGTSAPLVIKGNFTYTNCKRGSESCTVKEVNGPFSIKALKEGNETGSATLEGEVSIKCGFFINCTYNGEGLKATANGPLLSSETNGSLSLSEQITHKVGSGICPSEAKLDFTMTPLSATYIGNGEASDMACIELDDNTGLYSKPSSGDPSTSCESDDSNGNGKYELVLVPEVFDQPGKKVCAFTTGKGLFLWREANKCIEDREGKTGKWELGVIAT